MENSNIKKSIGNKTVYVVRGDDWTDPKIYEEKLKKKLAFGPPPYVLREKRRYEHWLANKEIMERAEYGDIQYINCSKCGVSKPYHDFYADYKGNKYGRMCACKACYLNSKKVPQINNPRNARAFATRQIIKIRRSLSIANGSYVDVNAKEIWAALGYTQEDLIKHFEGLMEPWMNWKNNITPKNADEKGWHVDHIIPMCNFKYNSIYDQQFRDCWALSNMRPIDWKENIKKGNKLE